VLTLARAWLAYAQARMERRPVQLLSGDLDDPVTLHKVKRAFAAEKSTEGYRAAFRETNPLVTVCITTADRGEILSERALTSMTRQSYKNLQVIVVGDQCEDDTEKRVKSFNDRRFQFINLPVRGPYPPPGHARWCVAGTYPANEALRRAEGTFITHIDEDDTFEDNRIEILVSKIQTTGADIVYHNFWWENEDNSWTIIGDGTFQHAQTGTSMVLYHRWFARIPWDVMAFKKSEPGDWNRFRKFAAVGGTTHHIPDVLTWHWRYPTREPFKAKAGERYLD
jgi:glycosyltransferase involved in cell wall biosynthesis